MKRPSGSRRVRKSCPLTAPKPSAKNAVDSRVAKVGLPSGGPVPPSTSLLAAKKVARRSRSVNTSKTMVPQEAPRHVCSQGERPPEARVGKRRVRKAATPSAQRELYMEEKGSPEKLRSNLSSHWKTLVRIGACTIRIRKIWRNDPQAAQTAAATWLRGGHCHARPSGPSPVACRMSCFGACFCSWPLNCHGNTCRK